MSNQQRPTRSNLQKRKMKRRRRIRRNLWSLATIVLMLGVAVLAMMVLGDGKLDQAQQVSAALATQAAPEVQPSAEAATPVAATPVAATPAIVTPTPAPTPEPTPEPTPVNLKYPYYVEVDRGKQVVTVYTIDEFGEYRHVVRQMICSTDKYDRKPPNGVYRLDGERIRWLTTVATPRSYAQYATRIAAKILFHSVPYETKKANDLDKKAYNALGTNASIGCIRLLCDDAKWIYDNLPAGTPVRFLTTERDTDLLHRLAPPPLQSGDWDPTDPDERNPDYDASYVKPTVTPWLGVTPAPTPSWKAATYK